MAGENLIFGKIFRFVFFFFFSSPSRVDDEFAREQSELDLEVKGLIFNYLVNIILLKLEEIKSLDWV